MNDNSKKHNFGKKLEDNLNRLVDSLLIERKSLEIERERSNNEYQLIFNK